MCSQAMDRGLSVCNTYLPRYLGTSPCAGRCPGNMFTTPTAVFLYFVQGANIS